MSSRTVAKRRDLSTGEVARLFGVTSPTIKSWVAQQLLSGWVTPGGRTRIHEAEVLRFAKARGIDLDLAEEPTPQAAE